KKKIFFFFWGFFLLFFLQGDILLFHGVEGSPRGPVDPGERERNIAVLSRTKLVDLIRYDLVARTDFCI
ncbi:hypothetical protein KCA24_25720, partial [Escherichia coli]|nr:hypothetical protein [Escherichia coli]